MNKSAIGILIVIVVVVFAIVLDVERDTFSDAFKNNDIISEMGMNSNLKSVRFKKAKEIVNPSGYINTSGITIQELIGKQVILVDFWTFSCINCQRTTPYLNSWYEKYKDSGLTILGIHTPEFGFEKEIENVQNAVTQYGISYPVILDNDYSTWNAYQNRYWPRKYLIDIDGYIVYDHIGEGGYEETERKIQELLAERAEKLGMERSVEQGIVNPEGTESVDPSLERSPEIYFGAERNSYLGNGQSGELGEQTFNEPGGVKANVLYLVGKWDTQAEYAESKSDGAKIIFRYQAQKVFMVASAESAVNLEIIIDDKVVKKIKVEADQLYRIFEDVEHGEHTLEIRVDKPGLRVFTFTFG